MKGKSITVDWKRKRDQICFQVCCK